MITKRVLSAFALILFAGCASINVNVQYDETVDFTMYKTFRFERPKQQGNRGAINNPFFAREVLQEIKPILESKGLSEAGTGEKADLLVVFYAFTQNQTDWMPPTYHVGRWGRVWRTSPGHPVHYKTGSLVIDIVDRVKRELVWQGIGNGVLDRYDPGRDLVAAVEKVLEQFPPGQ